MRSETYDGDEEGTLLSRSESVYDDLGRVYQSTSYAVDPTTGTVGNGLTGYTWYDAAGNTIKSQPAGSKVFSKTEFDSLGRAVATYVGYCAGETSYSEALSLACNSIVEQSETMFDEVG
ncbi:MAG: hypothetical protein HQ581_23865, partial [Planctomycetes bacterium]|nr:hypothetical protein [Planctomycetota bacterium]